MQHPKVKNGFTFRETICPSPKIYIKVLLAYLTEDQMTSDIKMAQQSFKENYPTILVHPVPKV
jgi:hypothetical protein